MNVLCHSAQQLKITDVLTWTPQMSVFVCFFLTSLDRVKQVEHNREINWSFVFVFINDVNLLRGQQNTGGVDVVKYFAFSPRNQSKLSCH